MPHVVIVEDDAMNARFMDTVLRRRGGFNVTVTEDVETLLRLAREGSADLVLMDVSLKNSVYRGRAVDGLQITRLLKEDPATASVPVILATAHAMRGDRERLLAESKADEYVSKPIVDQLALIETIKKWIAKKGAVESR